ncbi:hypothetical protein BS78_03G368900 [Paspalum vaginatum]|nr:hypothetical protein BS78_03G368900 [Paspalum vaginatum]KAJ1286660.1 hypothetical protein BS78_03G368900 [Paspalum vaginatum]
MRWRYIWASFPLVLDDADLLSDLPDGCDFGSTGRHTITDAISSILTWHPGPFRFVRLIHSCSYATTHNDGALLKNWLGVLARKGVEELVLFHPLSNTSAALPDIVLRISSVRCLDLRNWNFPSTRIICRDEGIFPNILELGLWHTDIGAASIDHILQYSPRLERFALIASYNTPRSVLIRSRSLLCLLFWNYIAQEIHVLAAPRLKRIILLPYSFGMNTAQGSSLAAPRSLRCSAIWTQESTSSIFSTPLSRLIQCPASIPWFQVSRFLP